MIVSMLRGTSCQFVKPYSHAQREFVSICKGLLPCTDIPRVNMQRLVTMHRRNLCQYVKDYCHAQKHLMPICKGLQTCTEGICVNISWNEVKEEKCYKCIQKVLQCQDVKVLQKLNFLRQINLAIQSELEGVLSLDVKRCEYLILRGVKKLTCLKPSLQL